MSDKYSPEVRRRMMRSVKSYGNRSTEGKLIQLLKQRGIHGWRRRQKLVGKPDFVWRKERVAVFLDGCFWHGCHRGYRRPLSNQEYWDKKVANNRKRDRLISAWLRRRGWLVIRIRECSLKKARGSLILKRLGEAISRRS